MLVAELGFELVKGFEKENRWNLKGMLFKFLQSNGSQIIGSRDRVF